jgi:hypothetical protein
MELMMEKVMMNQDVELVGETLMQKTKRTPQPALPLEQPMEKTQDHHLQ